jgi:hypothetical protein
MSKMQSRLINSASTLAFLLALSFAFDASQAYAMSSPTQTMFLDTTGEVAEWWICYSYSSGAQTCINTHRADIQLAAEFGRSGAARPLHLRSGRTPEGGLGRRAFAMAPARAHP